jgi:hypothetical protein
MAVQYQVIPSKDLSRGEDARSAPSAIPAGYSESLLNVNTNANGWAATRKGYQGYYGWVPIRVTSIAHTGTTIKLSFDSSQAIDLSNTLKGPLLVYGKLSSAQVGDFTTTDALRYYTGFVLSSKHALTSPSGTITLAQEDHGLDTPYIFLGTGTNTDTTSSDYTSFYPDSVDIDDTTYDVEIDYTIASSATGLVWFLDRPALAGTTHIESVVAETTVTVAAGGHNLDNFNILVRCFDTSVAGTNTEIIPDSVTVDSAGEVVVTFAAAFTGDIVYTCVSDSQRVVSSAVTGANTITIPDVTTPWVILSIYIYDSANTRYEQVLPESVSYSDTTGDLTIAYTVGGSAETVEVYYEYGTTSSNSVALTDTGAVSTTYEDLSPQLTVWGINHEGIYTENTTKGGHVTHLDVYRRAGEERAICGLGGNLFAARTRDEVGTTYGMPTFYANQRARVDGDVSLAPLFQETGSTDARTRGTVVDAMISDNRARVSAATYVSSGVVDYTLSFTSKTGSIAIGGVIDTTDYVTISGMPWAGHNGVFPILSVQSDSATETVIRVSNASGWGADFDAVGADGRAGVFTDEFVVESAAAFLEGDILTSSSIDSDLSVLVQASTGTTVVVSGVTDSIALPDGVRVFATRTSSLVPLRDTTGTATSTNLVAGDMLTLGGITRQARAVYVNPAADNSVVSITGDGEEATLTISAHRLNVGQRILLVGTGESDYDGIQVITSTPSDTSVTFASTCETTVGAVGRVIGHTVELDEELSVSDGNADASTFTVGGRWIPIEIPSTSGDVPATTQIRHLDMNGYAEQPRLRSNTISDSMFVTNGDDEVLKFDGDNLYQAGLFRWQAQLFSQVDTTTGSITIDDSSIAWTAKSANRFTVASGDAVVLPVGARVQDDSNDAIYTVVSVTTNATNDFIYLDRAITSVAANGNLTRVSRYSYYFRLRAIDANQNVVVSAATGASDCVIEMSEDAQIKHRLLGMPAFAGYDFDRIELDVFRTKRNTAAPFFLVKTVAVPFNSG